MFSEIKIVQHKLLIQSVEQTTRTLSRQLRSDPLLFLFLPRENMLFVIVTS